MKKRICETSIILSQNVSFYLVIKKNYRIDRSQASSLMSQSGLAFTLHQIQPLQVIILFF